MNKLWAVRLYGSHTRYFRNWCDASRLASRASNRHGIQIDPEAFYPEHMDCYERLAKGSWGK